MITPDDERCFSRLAPLDAPPVPRRPDEPFLSLASASSFSALRFAASSSISTSAACIASASRIFSSDISACSALPLFRSYP